MAENEDHVASRDLGQHPVSSLLGEDCDALKAAITRLESLSAGNKSWAKHAATSQQSHDLRADATAIDIVLSNLATKQSRHVGVGMVLAASQIVDSHGEEVMATEILEAAGLESEAAIRALGIEDYDLFILRPVLTEIARRNALSDGGEAVQLGDFGMSQKDPPLDPNPPSGMVEHGPSAISYSMATLRTGLHAVSQAEVGPLATARP